MNGTLDHFKAEVGKKSPEGRNIDPNVETQLMDVRHCSFISILSVLNRLSRKDSARRSSASGIVVSRPISG